MNNKKDDKAWQHVLKESRKNKEWAKNHEHADNPDAWKASMMSVEMLKKYLNTSVEDLAEERYRYFYMRAHATAGVFSRPIDAESRKVDIRKALRTELGSKLSDAQIDALIGLRISEQQGVLTSLFVTETAQARG